MKISEFKDSYPDSSSLPTTMFLNQAVDKVLNDNELAPEDDLTGEVLYKIYMTITRHEVRLSAELLLLAAKDGENSVEMALRVIDSFRKNIGFG